MWLWLSITLFLVSPVSYGAPTSLGPTSNEEREFLIEESRQFFHKDQYQQAINDLERLITRYPAHAGFLESHYLLGISFFRLKQYQKAVRPLKYFITEGERTTDRFAASILLGRSYMGLRQFHEAYLASSTVSPNNKGSGEMPESLHIEASLVKIRALLNLRKEQEANKLLGQAFIKLEQHSEAQSLTAEANELLIESKLMECAKLPGLNRSGKTPPSDELQILDQYGRRGTCLLETLIPLQKILKSNNMSHLDLASRQIQKGFADYRIISLRPPSPKRIPNSSEQRTETQVARYQSELAFSLFGVYKKTASTGIDLIKGWNVKESGPEQNILSKMIHDLRKSTAEPKNGHKNS